LPVNSGQEDDRADDFTLLADAVREAGALAASFYGDNLDHWKKDGDDTPVSEADLAVDALLKERLQGARPSYGWLSEETDDDGSRLSRERVWMVDPIDGTHAFINARPQWTVSAALVENGRPVLACVFNPINNEFFAARAKGGARLNGQPISIADRGEIDGCRMLANSRAFAPERWRKPWPAMEISYRNSVAYRLCLVAGGGFDAALAVSTKCDWDLAAADLVVQEAGGRASDCQGRPLVYNRPTIRQKSVLAAGPHLHDALLQRTREFKP